jgi:2,3-dihydroxyphenylpropionate 1,2-dioxygenase
MDYDGLVSDEVMSEVSTAVAGHRAEIEAYAPELVIKLGDDHASGFALSLMPPFTVGVRAYGVGDFKCSAGNLSVDEHRARQLVAFLHESGVDVAHSYRMPVDHGIVQLLDHYFGGIDRVPVIPVVINCGGDLRPPLHRARTLGQKIGEYVRRHANDLRVLIVGSGGLSHDPPLPVFMESSPEVQQRLIEGTACWTEELMEARVERVLAAAREHGRGEGTLLPLNPVWDRQIMQWFAEGDLDAICAIPDTEIVREGGRGGSEIRNWVAAFGAIEAYSAGRYVVHNDYYRAVPAWVVGLGMMHAEVQGE